MIITAARSAGPRNRDPSGGLVGGNTVWMMRQHRISGGLQRQKREFEEGRDMEEERF
jgi:hypothetical protein